MLLKMKFKNKRMSYIRLFAVNLLITMFYTFIIVGVLYYKNNAIFSGRVDSDMRLFVGQIKEKVDIKFTMGFNAFRELTSNINVRDYISSNDSDFYIITLVSQELSRHATALSLSEYTIALVKEGDDPVILPGRTLDRQSYWSYMGFDDETVETLAVFLETGNLGQYRLISSVDTYGKNRLTIAAKSRAGGNEAMYFITYYENELLPDLDSNTVKYLLISLGETPVASAAAEGFETDTLLDNQMLSTILEKNARGEITKISESGYGIYSVAGSVSELGNLLYVCVADNVAMSDEMKSFFIEILCTFGILLILSFAISRVISLKMYKPISETENKLRNVLEQGKEYLNERFWRKLMFGTLSEEETDKGMIRLGMNDEGDGFTIAVLEYDNYEPGRIAEEDMIHIKKIIFKLLKERFPQRIAYGVYELDPKRYFIIFKSDDTEHICKMLHDVLFFTENEYGVRLATAVGDACSSLEEAEGSFNEIIKILDLRFVVGNKMLYTIGDFDGLKNDICYYPIKTEQELVSHVIHGNADSVRAILNRVLRENLDTNRLGHEGRNQLIFALANTVNRILQQTGKTLQDFFGTDIVLYIEMKMCENNEELKTKIYELFDSLIQQIRSQQKYVDNLVADKMFSYIHEKFDVDISLEDMAKALNMSAGYVCVLFKDVCGVNFKTYLNEYRIKKAKEILDSGQVDIQSLAKMVGYNSSGTFIRVFKKVVGVSPGKYREG